MSDRTDLIEVLEGQAVYINAAQRAVPGSVCRLLLREEILAANVRVLQILHNIRPCTGCAARQIEIDRLALELGTAQAKIAEIRRLLAAWEERVPMNPYIAYEGEPLLVALARIIGRAD